MPIEFIPAICSNCGGQLRVPEDRKTIIKCIYCGYDIIIHETKSDPPQSSGKPGQWFRVVVTETSTGKSRANIRIPLGVINAGMKMGAHFTP